MRQLTEREKRTIRIAAVAIAIYLGFFYGVRGWNRIEAARLDYQQLVLEAQRANRDLRAFENRVLLLDKLKETLRVDPTALSKDTVVAESSAAIQKAAKDGNIELGPIREGPGSQAAYELATMQLEAVGEVAAILTLIHRLEALGFPLIVDSLQFTPDSRKPGSLKVNVQLIILDFDRWISMEEKRNA